ncbi:speriolin-like protein [Eucyclogobius newberryi]|uniref:speriolin-like protein n=1 Tax=Eucyclogobius newberryi TaxID=166745 RepID=UPI003B5AD383
MDEFISRNEELVRENERLKRAVQTLISENRNLLSTLQRLTGRSTEEETLPAGPTRTSDHLQSTVNEEQFGLGLQQHRVSSPVNLKMLFESSSYVENKDTGFASQDSVGDKELAHQLLGEIAYQLDRRILSQIFKCNKTFYGYTLSNIPCKIIVASAHPLTGKVDEDYRHHLNQRYEHMKETLSHNGYKITLHPHFSEFIVNTYGILKMRPKEGTSQAIDFYNPRFLRSVIETTAPLKLQNDLVVLLNCLCDLSEKDTKPLFLW